MEDTANNAQDEAQEANTDERNEVPTPKDVAEKAESSEPKKEPKDEAKPDQKKPTEKPVDEDDDESDDDSQGSTDLLKKLRRKNKENEGLRSRALTAEVKLLRYEAAEKAGLPLNVAARLQGSTAEELAKDAETLKELLGLKSPIHDSPRDGARRGSAKDEVPNLDEIGKRMYGV